MAEEVRRRYRWYVEQYDPATGTLYVRVELDGVWVATINVSEKDLKGKSRQAVKDIIDIAVRRAIAGLKPLQPPQLPQVPEEYRLEGEGEV